MTTDLTKVAEEFSAYMLTKFRTKIEPKETSDLMKAVAFGFDLARGFGTGGLSSGQHFMTHVTTTLGDTIYMPESIRTGNRLAFMEILTHECQHIAEYHKAPFAMSWLYATEAEARVKYETDAYAAGLSLLVWLTTNLNLELSAEGIVASLVAGYHLQPRDADLATVVLKSHLASLKHGIVMSESGREAVAWFEKNHPELKGAL